MRAKLRDEIASILPGVLIIVLLAIIMWRARPGGAQ